jgi:hypothetical protein
MLYSTIVQRDETGLNQIFEAAKEFDELNVLEAIVDCRFDKRKIEQTLSLVRMYQMRLNIESAELVAFSENFIEQYATDNNKCFRVALKLVRKIGTTITGSMKIFRKFCPVVRKKLEGPDNIVPVLDYTKLTNRKYSGQLFGPEVYTELVQTLLHELATFFFHLVSVLKVCKDMIRKEEEVRGDFTKLKKIWDNSCAEVIKGVIEISETFGQVQLVSEDELQQRKKNARPLKEWLAPEYHNHDKKWIRKEAYIQRIISGQVDGLDDTASQLWANNHQKGQEVCRVIKHFDDLGLSFKNTKTKGKKGKYDSMELVYFLKWSEVSQEDESGKVVDEENEKRLYRYLCENYQGAYELPSWQAVCRQRAYCYQEFTLQEMKDAFASHLPI